MNNQLEVDTPEFRKANNRRIDLILNRNKTSAEIQELEHLQREVGAAINRRFPPPCLDPEDLKIVKKALGEQS